MAEQLIHDKKTYVTESVTRETPFRTAGDLYAALAFLTLEGVDLDKYKIRNPVTFYLSRTLTLERLPDGN